jgi:hypothetical protein
MKQQEKQQLKHSSIAMIAAAAWLATVAVWPVRADAARNIQKHRHRAGCRSVA